MANFVFSPCPNSAQKGSKFASHSVYSGARHVFDRMPTWSSCKGSTSHLHATRPCRLLVVFWTAGSLADIPIHFLAPSFALHRRDGSMSAMAMAELLELHGRRCSFSSKRSHAQPASPPPPPLPPLQPAPLGRGGRPPEQPITGHRRRRRRVHVAKPPRALSRPSKATSGCAVTSWCFPTPPSPPTRPQPAGTGSSGEVLSFPRDQGPRVQIRQNPGGFLQNS